MKKPIYHLYVPQEFENNGEKNTFWHRVGVAFEHKEGKGMNIIIPPGISVSGKVVLMEPKEKEEQQ